MNASSLCRSLSYTHANTQVGARVERCAEAFSEYRHLKLELDRVRELQQALAGHRGLYTARSALDRFSDHMRAGARTHARMYEFMRTRQPARTHAYSHAQNYTHSHAREFVQVQQHAAC